jgi:putative flippase GtrA
LNSLKHILNSYLGDSRFVLKYIAVGLSNTVIGFLIFILSNEVFKDSFHYLAILVFSFSISVTTAYFLHRYLVFHSSEPLLREYLKFVSVNLGGLILNAFFLAIFVTIGLGVVLAQGLSLIIVTVLSFFGHLKFTFTNT